jgi:hypothetical protein
MSGAANKVQPPLTFADSEVIDAMEPLAREFLDKVLDLDLDSCLITDESSLSDFAPRGLPEGLVAEGATYAQTLDAWDAWILGRVEHHFGHRPQTTGQTLVVILAAIERHQANGSTSH